MYLAVAVVSEGSVVIDTGTKNKTVCDAYVPPTKEKAFSRGVRDARRGNQCNPYKRGTEAYKEWWAGQNTALYFARNPK